MTIVEQVAKLLTAVFVSVTGMPTETPKDYLYNDNGRSAFLLSHAGSCEDLGLNTKDLVLKVVWNDTEGRVDAQMTQYQDYDNKMTLPMPGGDGCLQKDAVIPAEFMLRPGTLTRDFYEDEFGADVLHEIKSQNTKVLKQRILAIS